MMKKLAFLILLLAHGMQAQYMDSLRDVIRKKSSFTVRLEKRFGFIDNRRCDVSGIRLGISFERKLRMGGGISWLDVGLPVYNRPQTGENPGDTSYLKFTSL